VAVSKDWDEETLLKAGRIGYMFAEHDITTAIKFLNPYTEVNYYVWTLKLIFGLSVSLFMAGMQVLVEEVFLSSWAAIIYIGIFSNLIEDTTNFSIEVSDLTIAQLKEMSLKDFSDSYCPFYCTICPTCWIRSIRGFNF
jgi:hypothetical protein